MKIALLGYGKMGKTIEKIIQEEGKHEVVLKIGSQNADDLTIESLQKADVAIEFSIPRQAVKHIEMCLTADVPVVVGTTAWHEHLPAIQEKCTAKNGSLIHATNFSIGVNIFNAINQKLADIMQHQLAYEVEVEEIHHTEKLDAPSGTAITIADDIISRLDRKKSWKLDKTERSEELLITAKRLPNVPGTHTITYRHAVDTIELKHTAHSRAGFAQGAIKAAEWILTKKGCFTMQDMLQL